MAKWERYPQRAQIFFNLKNCIVMKKLELLICLFIELWKVLPAWLKTIIVFLIVYAMGQNGIFDKP